MMAKFPQEQKIGPLVRLLLLNLATRGGGGFEKNESIKKQSNQLAYYYS